MPIEMTDEFAVQILREVAVRVRGQLDAPIRMRIEGQVRCPLGEVEVLVLLAAGEVLLERIGGSRLMPEQERLRAILSSISS